MKARTSHWFLSMMVAIVPLSSIRAQQGQPGTEPTDKPTGPLLKPAPEFAKWTITYSYPEGFAPPKRGSSGDVLPKAVVVEKTKSVISEEITDIYGEKHIRFYVDGVQYNKDPNVPYWSAHRSNVENYSTFVDPGLTPLPEGGFRGLDWIGEETYVTTIPSAKTSLLVFVPVSARQHLGPAEHLAADTLQKIATVALIDRQTRLPVLQRASGVTQTYQFSDIPRVIQSFPEDLLAQLVKAKKAQEMMERPATRPY